MRFRTMFLAAALMIATAFSAYAAPTEPADMPHTVAVTDSPDVVVPVAASAADVRSAVDMILALMPDDGSLCYDCPKGDCDSGPGGRGCTHPPAMASSVVALGAARARFRT